MRNMCSTCAAKGCEMTRGEYDVSGVVTSRKKSGLDIVDESALVSGKYFTIRQER